MHFSHRKGGDAFDFYFLSMALWRLGEGDKAREWLGKADEWTEEHAPQDGELRRFRAEAALSLAGRD